MGPSELDVKAGHLSGPDQETLTTPQVMGWYRLGIYPTGNEKSHQRSESSLWTVERREQKVRIQPGQPIHSPRAGANCF